MIQYIRKKTTLVLMLASLLSMTGCLEDPTEEVRTAGQLFRPIQFTAGVNGASVDFSWVPIKNATYSLEISRDSLLFTNELQIIPLDSTAGYTVEDLWSQSTYSARIKAVSTDPAVKDSEYQTIVFKTGIENIFFKVDTATVFSNRLLLAWDPLKTVSHIKVLAGVEEEASVTLTEAEKAEGAREITGLKPATSYTFKIYNGDMLRGTITAITKAGS